MAKSLIKTYGLRWHASRVQWSGRNEDVGLWGVPAKQRRTEPTNFADQIAIYVLYDGEIPIYVGQSGAGNNKLMGRLKHHRADRLADRWDRFSWFGLCGCTVKWCDQPTSNSKADADPRNIEPD